MQKDPWRNPKSNLQVERELELPGPDGVVAGRWSNAIWDESGAFVIYPTLLGIKGLANGALVKFES